MTFNSTHKLVLFIFCIILLYCRTVPGSIPGGVTGNFFRGSPRRNHVPWGRLSLWKWVPGISPGVKAAGAYGWRPTTPVVPNVTKNRGLNLPGTPCSTSACCGMTFTFILLYWLPDLYTSLQCATGILLLPPAINIACLRHRVIHFIGC